MPKCVDCASGIGEGGDFRQVVSTTTPRNKTDLVLRLKATGDNTTLVARQEMYNRIALMSFLCRFPSWAYA